MKSKASLVLMEQLIMLLVFALAAALCLGVFAQSNEISLQTARRDEAGILAQNAAEILRATGDAALAQTVAENSGYTMIIQEEPSEIQGFCQATIVVFCEDSEVISLRTGWQEVDR